MLFKEIDAFKADLEALPEAVKNDEAAEEKLNL